MRLGVASWNPILTAPIGPLPADLIIAQEETHAAYDAVLMTKHALFKEQQKLQILHNAMDISQEGLSRECLAFITNATHSAEPYTSLESIWDGIVSTYEAIKKYILELLERFWNWIVSFFKENEVTVMALRMRLNKLIINYDQNKPTVEYIKSVKTNFGSPIDTIKPLYLTTGDGPLAILNNFGRPDTKLFDHATISSLAAFLFGPVANYKTAPLVWDPYLKNVNGMIITSLEQSIIPHIQTLPPERFGWSPVMVIELARAVVDPVSTFGNDWGSATKIDDTTAWRAGRGEVASATTSLGIFKSAIFAKKAQAQIIEPEMKSLAEQFGKFNEFVKKDTSKENRYTVHDSSNALLMQGQACMEFCNRIIVLYGMMTNLAARHLVLLQPA